MVDCFCELLIFGLCWFVAGSFHGDGEVLLFLYLGGLCVMSVSITVGCGCTLYLKLAVLMIEVPFWRWNSPEFPWESVILCVSAAFPIGGLFFSVLG